MGSWEVETTDRLTEAFAFAADLHRTQLRKGTEVPYLSHLMAVAALVQEHGGDEDQVIAALLHDGPEDQGGEETLSEIRQRFGNRVANIVEACSDTFEEPKPPWKPRKQSYLSHLASATEDTLLISLADKVHNLGCIARDYRNHGEALWPRFKTGQEGTLWYYGKLLEVYKRKSTPQFESLIAQLRRSFDELTQLTQEVETNGPEKTTTGKYTVLVDDNYHYMDESARHSGGSFNTLDAATDACKKIVDESLKHCHEAGMTASELFGKYKMFGEDPFIRAEDPSVGTFSAWDYAEEQSQVICKGKDS